MENMCFKRRRLEGTRFVLPEVVFNKCLLCSKLQKAVDHSVRCVTEWTDSYIVCIQVQSTDMPVGALCMPRPPFSTVSHDLYYFLCCGSIRCGSHLALNRTFCFGNVCRESECLSLSLRISLRDKKLQRMMFPIARIHMRSLYCIVQLKCDGTRRRKRGEVKGKLANGVGSQYSSHYIGTWCIQHYYLWCAHLGCQ